MQATLSSADTRQRSRVCSARTSGCAWSATFEKLLDRNFIATAPNQIWLAEITATLAQLQNERPLALRAILPGAGSMGAGT
ncbi:hypothetical protein [Bradyrhizobium ottawaense]|uniref:hypothetical protein n=1 Tax=Bradyrhizobium ottawaense TaxID=931866 RepID=UPI003FA130C2